MGLSAFFVFDAFTEFFSAFTALAVAYYAIRAHRVLEDSRMLALNLGFSILGAGMLLHGGIKVKIALAVLSGVKTPPARMMPEVRIGYVIAFATQFAAYILILIAMLAGEGKLEESLLIPPLAIPLIEYDARTEGLLALLTALIAVRAGLSYSESDSRWTALVTASFALLALSHALLVFGGPRLLVTADISRLLGFACLLWMLVGVSRVGE